VPKSGKALKRARLVAKEDEAATVILGTDAEATEMTKREILDTALQEPAGVQPWRHSGSGLQVRARIRVLSASAREFLVYWERVGSRTKTKTEGLEGNRKGKLICLPRPGNFPRIPKMKPKSRR